MSVRSGKQAKTRATRARAAARGTMRGRAGGERWARGALSSRPWMLSEYAARALQSAAPVRAPLAAAAELARTLRRPNVEDVYRARMARMAALRDPEPHVSTATAQAWGPTTWMLNGVSYTFTGGYPTFTRGYENANYETDRIGGLVRLHLPPQGGDMATTAAATVERAKACTNCGNHYLKADPAVPGAWYCPNPNPKACGFRIAPPGAQTVQVQTDNAGPEALKTAEALARATAEAEKRAREDERAKAKVAADEAARVQAELQQKLLLAQRDTGQWRTVSENWERTANENATRAADAQRLVEARTAEVDRLRALGATTESARITELERAVMAKQAETEQAERRRTEISIKLDEERHAHATQLDEIGRARISDQERFTQSASGYVERIRGLEGAYGDATILASQLEAQVAELQSMLDTEVSRNNPTKKHQDGASRRHQEGMTTMADDDKSISDRLGDVADEFKDLFIDTAARAAGGAGVDLLVGMTREALHSRGYWPEKLDSESGRAVAEVIVPATVYGVASMFPDIPYAKQAKAVAKRGLQAKGQSALEKVIKFFTPQALGQYFYRVSSLDKVDVAGTLESGGLPLEEPVDFTERQHAERARGAGVGG